MNKLVDDWNHITEVVVYGYGRKAVRLLDFISNDFAIKGIIDNNPQLENKNVNGINIQPLKNAKDKLERYKILVTVGGVSYYSIKESLMAEGLVEFKDFCSFEDFLTEWYWKNRQEVIMSESYITITSRCTFKCKNCDQLMPYYNSETHWEVSINEIERTLEAFFSKADYLVSFFIVGGEPLLYKNLPELLEMICEKYGKKIGYIQVITNGSIIPNAYLMEVLKKYDIDIRLSDYTCSIKYIERFDGVKKTLENNRIPYSISKYEKWYDVGIPGREETQFNTLEEIKQHAIDCAPCHVIAENRFYYCGSYYNAVKCGFVSDEKTGYIDLTTETTIERKLELLNYSRGIVDENYLKVCNRCFGKSGKSLREVEPAVQIEGV